MKMYRISWVLAITPHLDWTLLFILEKNVKLLERAYSLLKGLGVFELLVLEKKIADNHLVRIKHFLLCICYYIYLLGEANMGPLTVVQIVFMC